MKHLFKAFVAALLLLSCNKGGSPVVQTDLVDSLLRQYTDIAIRNAIDKDLEFWKAKIEPSKPGMVSELKYASCLVQRFHLTGDINDIQIADSILYTADRAFNHKESSPNLALVQNSILQHRFKQADSLLNQAKISGIKKYVSAAIGFDVAFESGNYFFAEAELKKIANERDFGYNFRLAKLAHYKGDLDDALKAMHRAVETAGNTIALKQAALSNAGDLYLHKGMVQKAFEFYKESLQCNAPDIHSISQLGWIALVHDRNDSLAEKIFRFVQSKTKAPDVLFKLVQVAVMRSDTVLQKNYAREFVATVAKPAYGNMYNKYLLQLYTGILQQPGKAEAIARQELLNRATPQTYAWYVWALFNNKKPEDAEKVYRQYVSGKPLEGLELYWMGKYMQAQQKKYNATQYFKAAYKNRYDLSPQTVKDIESFLE